MYIKKDDFGYFERLCEDLDETRQRKFLDILLKSVTTKKGTEASKIQIVGDEIFDERGIEPGEFVTRTMIKKAYKEARGE